MAAYMCSLAKWPVQRQDAYCTAYMRACNIKVANTLVTLNSCEHNPTQLVKKSTFSIATVQDVQNFSSSSGSAVLLQGNLNHLRLRVLRENAVHHSR